MPLLMIKRIHIINKYNTFDFYRTMALKEKGAKMEDYETYCEQWALVEGE